MALQTSVATFAGPVPDMDTLLAACYRVSSMAVSARGGEVVFDSQPDRAVKVSRNTEVRGFSLSHETGHAPALFLVLQHALASLGGTFRSPLPPLPPVLTPVGVAAYDAAERREFDRAGRRLLILFASIVALFLALAGSVAYLGFRSLFGS
jgi:hypothetical protein